MSLFAKSEPIVETTYEALLRAVGPFGTLRVEEKKTSIHLCCKSSFAGVHPRRSAVLLNVRSAGPIKNLRIRKTERVSAIRFHNELLVRSPQEVDAELVGWLKEAYALSAS